MAIVNKSHGVPSVRPVSALSTAKKAAQIWAYIDAPVEALALKLLSAAKAEIKNAQAIGKAPESFSYGFSESDTPHIEAAIERFTKLDGGYDFGLDYDKETRVAKFAFPQGKLESVVVKKAAKK